MYRSYKVYSIFNVKGGNWKKLQFSTVDYGTTAEDRILKKIQHVSELSRGKHDGLLVYDVEADKTKRALTPCFQNSKVR